MLGRRSIDGWKGGKQLHEVAVIWVAMELHTKQFSATSKAFKVVTYADDLLILTVGKLASKVSEINTKILTSW